MSPSGPGSSGKAQRTGWVVEKTKRPPGRSTRAASRSTASESATKGMTPYAVKTTSKTGVGEGQDPAVALEQRDAQGRLDGRR